MNNAELIAGLDANYFESWRMLSEASGFVHDEDGILITAPSPSLAWMNVVFVKEPLREPEAQLVRSFAMLDERKLPFFVHMREGLDEVSERACEQLGRVSHESVPGMALAPVTTREIETLLDIRPALDDETFSDFVSITAESFDIPLDEARAMFPPEARRRPNTQYWVGYADGKAAACSGLIVIGDVAGINMIGTLAQHRGRGFGAAVTWQAVNAGTSAGCRFAVLQASEMGRPVYERMGFREVTSYTTYLRPG